MSNKEVSHIKPSCYMCPNHTDQSRRAFMLKSLLKKAPTVCEPMRMVSRVEIGAYDPEISPGMIVRQNSEYVCPSDAVRLAQDEEVVQVSRGEEKLEIVTTLRGSEIARAAARAALGITEPIPSDLPTITAQHWSPEG